MEQYVVEALLGGHFLSRGQQTMILPFPAKQDPKR